MTGRRTLVRGGHVVTVDPRLGTIVDGEVLIEDELIVAVGRDLGVSDAEVIDARGRIVAPGTVDTHRHTWQTQLRGCCSDMSLSEYLFDFWGHAVGAYTAEDTRLGVLVGALEGLDAGVTTLFDYCHVTNTPAHADASVDALLEAGIRGVFAYGLGQRDPMAPPEFDRMADATRLAGERFSADGRLSLGIGLSEIGLVPISTSRAEKRLADDLGAIAAAHIAPFFDQPTGIAELGAAGVFDSRFICVHASTLSSQEWDLVAAAGVKVASTPETELNLGAKAPAVREVLRRGLLPTIGSDIVTLSGCNVLASARLALDFTRWADAQERAALRQDVEAVSVTAAEALKWATINGADALGLADRVGSLTPGKQADLIIVGGSHLGARPVNDPVGQLIFQTTPQQIETVLVAGRVVKRDGRLIGFDLDALLDRLDESGRQVRERMARSRRVAVAPTAEQVAAMAEWVSANLAA